MTNTDHTKPATAQTLRMTRTFLFGVALTAFLAGAYVGTFFINQETRHFCALLASNP